MPEGHTVHRLARDLSRTLGGDVVRASSPQGRFEAGAAVLDGRTLEGATAFGKYLFCDVGGGDVLHVHLGLIGRFRRRPTPPPDPVGQVRLRLEGPGATWDLSGPSRCEVLTPGDVEDIVGRLGPDPLRPGADGEEFARRLARTRRPVAAALLDQRIVAGIGNVYRAEILFLRGVHPARPAASLDRDEAEGIWSTAVDLLRVGVRTGRIVTTDPDEVGRPRSRMRAEDRLYVYHREHCRRCGTALAVADLGGRPVWFCPRCQPG